jgi:acetyl-CoA carboxylase biotin carboxyl carrier protein
MDTRRIRKLIELVKETGIGELEVKSGDESVRISCHSNLTATPAGIPQAPVNIPTATPVSVTPESTAVSSSDTDQQEGYTQKSPMVGTAYLSSTPGEAPFVKVGQHVEAGDTLCLIEAMKMFNKIEADKAGVISARLIENESPVEFDQPLFIIDTNE